MLGLVDFEGQELDLNEAETAQLGAPTAAKKKRRVVTEAGHDEIHLMLSGRREQ